MKKVIIKCMMLFGILCLFQTEIFSQDRSINSYYNRMGINEDGIHNIENLLVDSGIEQEDLEVVKRCIISITREIPDKSRECKLSDKNKDYLENKLGLKLSQISIIKRIAFRISLGQRNNLNKEKR